MNKNAEKIKQYLQERGYTQVSHDEVIASRQDDIQRWQEMRQRGDTRGLKEELENNHQLLESLQKAGRGSTSHPQWRINTINQVLEDD